MTVPAFALMLGLAVGSFVNVVLHRVPRGESVAWPPSHCPACGHWLSPWELVPVVSWVVLGGRCRECRRSISSRYPMVELATGTVAAASGHWAGLPGSMLALALLVGLAWAWGLLGRRLHTEQAGSTLAEVAVAAVLFSLVVISLMDLLTGSLASARSAQRRAVALNLAREKMEYLSSIDWAGLASMAPSPAESDSVPGYSRTWDVTYDGTVGSPDGSSTAEAVWITVRVDYQGGTAAASRAAVTLASRRGKDE